MVAGALEGLPDHADLAVHHPGGAEHVRTGLGLRDAHPGVDLQRRVVVHGALGGEHAAVAVVGELVQAQVGHHDEPVPHLRLHVPDGPVQDAVRVQGGAADGVARGRHAEQHDAAQAQLGGLGRGGLERVRGVLHDARHRGDRHGLGGALLDEGRQDQLGGVQARLGDEAAHRGGPAQTPGTVQREGHDGVTRSWFGDPSSLGAEADRAPGTVMAPRPPSRGP